MAKWATRIIVGLVTYFLLRFPAGLFESWFQGEVLKDVAISGLHFVFIVIVPFLMAVGVVALINMVWNGLLRYRAKVRNEYQQGPAMTATVRPEGTLSMVVGREGGLKWELATINAKNRLLETPVIIQSARFIKPMEVVIRPDHLPIIIACETHFWKRIRNKLLLNATPRIIVKQLTGKGIIWDEEQTTGTSIVIGFYEKR